MLIGGRPLPERPPWVRLLTVAILLGAIAPLIRPAISALPLFGINRPDKMTAEETAAALPRRLSWRLVKDIRCEEHKRTTDWTPERTGAWDYVCTFVAQQKSGPKGLKVGVRVGHETITELSPYYDLEARYIKQW
jgi:hypothetical protein